MLHVILDKPGNRRHMAVPRPTGFFRMAVDAGMSEYIHYGWGNVCAQQQWRASSIRCFMREKMHQYRRKKPHQKQTRDCESHTRGRLQAGSRALVCDCLAHALQDPQGGKWIPGQCPRKARANSRSSALFRSDTTQYVVSAPFQWRIW